MRFIYGKNDWNCIDRGQESCYLLTNGLGGFSSTTIVGSSARNDQAFLMACLTAPNNRYNIINKLGEVIIKNNNEYDLTTQEYMESKDNRLGFKYLSKFAFEDIPEWSFIVSGIEVIKKIAMKQGENTIAVKYLIRNHTDEECILKITPYMEFIEKGVILSKKQEFTTTKSNINSNNITINYKTNGDVKIYDTQHDNEMFFAHDERDGRDKNGLTAYNHNIDFKVGANENKEFYIVYSTNEINESADKIIKGAIDYRKTLVKQAGLKDDMAKMLVKSVNQFVVNRESTKGKSIIAGYPFFADWGRDTMIALGGCSIATRQFEDAKNIFRTFMYYCKKGIMPNLFPEGESGAMYNTVDASLLFINAIYDYYKESHDLEFIKEAYSVMEDIIKWYRNGTDFDIKMNEDGLISAGNGLDQVTWMDVRVNDILPTPRHGKPVEINAYWYSALMIMDEFAEKLDLDKKDYSELAILVKKSFLEKFWNKEKNCLRDVISYEKSKADNQIRCNQIWAVSMAYSMLNEEKAKAVVKTVFEKLYTPYGLRSLSMDDEEFKGFYGGEMLKRDLAYHQGTTWGFPLGAYYISYLKVNNYSKESINMVKEQLEVMESCLREGCIGQIAEIYDGENPTISKGCFAQAWSTAEILKVYKAIEVHGGEI